MTVETNCLKNYVLLLLLEEKSNAILGGPVCCGVVQWPWSAQQHHQPPGLRHGGRQPGPAQPGEEHCQHRAQYVSFSAHQIRPDEYSQQTGWLLLLTNNRYICV